MLPAGNRLFTDLPSLHFTRSRKPVFRDPNDSGCMLLGDSPPRIRSARRTDSRLTSRVGYNGPPTDSPAKLAIKNTENRGNSLGMKNFERALLLVGYARGIHQQDRIEDGGVRWERG